ncbi:gastrulation defective protein 1 [Ditylenchus destructor]|nr:gastrulation defective protein 1 [Ditylenchus destructor]
MQENTQGEEQSRPSETENSQEHETKKVGKKARVFDLDTVLAQSIEGAKIRNAAGGSGGSALSSGGLSLQESIESLSEASENTNERVDFQSVEEDDGFDEQLTASSLIPAACEATIHHGSKPVSAITFDAQGSKFATGSYDYSVNLYEFLKMDSSMKSFRQIQPSECHIINDIAFNGNGETLLVATGNAQLKLLDRQGKQWGETIRGDQYLVDLSNTKGHTAAVNACCWNPLVKTEFMTCSDDGTLRIWDTGDYKAITKCINQQRKVIKTKNASGKRAIPTTCCYSHDGKLIAAGCDDGSIQIWKNGKIFVNTTYLNRKAHNGAITRLQFSPDGKRILSRSMDDTLKLFDLAKFKEPREVVKNLDTMFIQTDCGYSPHAEFVFTCTSLKTKEGEAGSLRFFDSETLELLYRIDYPTMGCIRAIWHPKINQMMVGLSDGNCRIYYEPGSSFRGALLCAERPVKRARKSEVVKEEIILSPLTLEMFQPRGEEGEEKEVTEWRIKKFLRMQSGSKRPTFRKPAEMPMSGPSVGGRLAQSGGTLHSYIAQQIGTSRNMGFLADEDVRASILKHAEAAEKEPLYISKAYRKTQPTPIFQESTEEEEQGDEEVKEPMFKVPKLG